MKRFNAIYTVFKKELARFLKDKRTLASLVFPGILIYVVYSLMGNFMSDMFQTDEDYKPAVSISGLPEEIADMFSGEVFDIKEFSNIEAEKQKVADGDLDATLVFPENFLENMLAYVPVQGGPPAPNVEVYFNTTSSESQVAYTSIMAILDSLESGISNKFDINNSPTDYDMASEEDMASVLFATIMPMLLIMFCVVGCMAVAPESIAGEKERGTIATMLITPIKRSHIALGKIFALSILALISGASSAIGVIASLPKLMGGTAEFDGSVYGVTDYIFLAIVILSTTLLFVSIVSIISCLAKSVKEATSYVSLLMILAMVIGITGFLGGDESPIWVFFIPVYNSVQCIVEIFSFEFDPIHVLIATATNIAVTCGGIFVLTRMFNSEKIMFKK